jgi:hypothetical protein
MFSEKIYPAIIKAPLPIRFFDRDGSIDQDGKKVYTVLCNKESKGGQDLFPWAFFVLSRQTKGGIFKSNY